MYYLLKILRKRAKLLEPCFASSLALTLASSPNSCRSSPEYAVLSNLHCLICALR